MKRLQTKVACMKNRDVVVDEVDCIPSPAYPNGPHYGYHDFFELEVYLSGRGVHYLNAVPYEVRRGYAYLLLPGDFHRYELEPDVRMNMLNVKIDARKIPPAILEAIRNAPHPFSTVLSEGQLSCTVEEIRYLGRLLGESPTDAALCANVLERVLLLLLRATCAPVTSLPSPVEHSTVHAAVQYLNAHYHEPINQSILARAFGMSTNYFGVYFKRHTGMSVREYLGRVRLCRGAQLLKSTGMKIMEIAARTGFGSAEYFARQFREQFGMTPKQYRDSLME